MQDARPRLDAWCRFLEARHLATLSFPEVRRGVQALSRLYVERGRRLSGGGALDGAGKRAAFALYFSPLHFLTVDHVVRSLELHEPAPATVLDLGCGTGAAGAAWAVAAGGIPRVRGVDLHPWVLQEAAATYRCWALRARTVRSDLARIRPDGATVAAWVVNELGDTDRETLLGRLLRGPGPVLVVEPVASGPAPWWSGWRSRFETAGGRADEWRFAPDLPEIVRRLDRAARLDHRELTARSLLLPRRA